MPQLTDKQREVLDSALGMLHTRLIAQFDKYLPYDNRFTDDILDGILDKLEAISTLREQLLSENTE